MKCQHDRTIKPLTGQLTLIQKGQTMAATTKPIEPSQHGTADAGGISSQFSQSGLERNAILPSEEIIAVNAVGALINQPCSHRKIPGLDADFCSTCRIWWVDQQMRDRLLAAKTL